MKNLLLVAAIGMLSLASCRSSTCPAYAQKTDRAENQNVMVKANPEVQATSRVNG
ncbi:hypothetical protein [Rufibacter roseus]|uniref:Uncharacterized protein n=1 Tax=Rufibacter roseus TaxID=1567108 RepID=A0ABW2DR67_9BACT|nr:hypothetical protein [Rufibacter roseus]